MTAVVQDPTSPPLHVVSDGYLSFAMDMSLVFGGTDAPVQEMYVDWNNSRLRNAVKMVRACVPHCMRKVCDVQHKCETTPCSSQAKAHVR